MKYNSAVKFLILFFKTELFIWFSVEESVANGLSMAAFAIVHARFYRRTTGKSF